jgi:hypothetical protein
LARRRPWYWAAGTAAGTITHISYGLSDFSDNHSAHPIDLCSVMLGTKFARTAEGKSALSRYYGDMHVVFVASNSEAGHAASMQRPWRKFMYLHHRAASVVALLVTALLTLGGTAPTWAAAHSPAAGYARTLPATSLTNKTILPDTSIDGPALASIGNESVLAWTGTDAAHHLNVETSTDGLHYGNKLTLNQTSPFRPDVALASQGGAVAVAWTGTDPRHSLNVLFDVYGSSPKKLTLHNENSFTAPALLIGPGFFLAWAGTDANHSLNILSLSITSSGVVPGTKTVLSDSSDAGPHLGRSSATVMDLLWSARTTLQLKIATGTQPAFLQPSFQTGTAIAETSAAAPDSFALGPFIGAGNQEWMGWTGTDAADTLNLQSTMTFPNFPNPSTTKTILSDTAIGGPAVSFNSAVDRNLLAWTGTDSAHSLNIATFG